jgi:hypothetical protein
MNVVQHLIAKLNVISHPVHVAPVSDTSVSRSVAFCSTARLTVFPSVVSAGVMRLVSKTRYGPVERLVSAHLFKVKEASINSNVRFSLLRMMNGGPYRALGPPHLQRNRVRPGFEVDRIAGLQNGPDNGLGSLDGAISGGRSVSETGLLGYKSGF